MSDNRLASASSAYLRGAAHQPVHWLPWAEEAFARARAEDKPILLDVGAVWCHWCHVIDHESYDDPDVAAIINEHFVAVKVDRDERPDIDARYQHAVSAITGAGGWPLTAFLTPEGKVFYGGTYFPKEDRFGRPGFTHVLRSVAAYYRDQKTDAVEAADQLHRQLTAALIARSDGALSDSLLDAATASITRLFDAAQGGFGGAPKFPHPSTIELLLRRYFRTRDEGLLTMVTRTLEKMGRGGIHDQIGGGFHRYSTDGRWILPHFEKMLYDNAGLLANYAHAFQATGLAYFNEVARGTAEFMAAVLYDANRGGFYGSQDADVGPDDDGSYFTWSEEEARSALSADEFAVVAEHLHLRGEGEMEGEPRRHVLFIDRDADVISAMTRRPSPEVERLLHRGREKLVAARARRQVPYVDTALYANWNGMAISAFLQAAVAIGEPRYRDLGLRTLDRFITNGYSPQAGFVHALGGDGVRLLDDEVQMAQALLDAYEMTGQVRYLRLAREVMETTVRDYWEDAGFLDVPQGTRSTALDAPYKPVQDAPTPAPNAVGALVLVRLARLLDVASYQSLAERLLAAFAPGLASHGLYASTLFIALDELLHEPAHITIVGARDDPRTRTLHETALATWRPDKLISLHGAGMGEVPLPAPVKAMLARSEEPTAYVCTGTACAPPTSDPQVLVEITRTFGRS